VIAMTRAGTAQTLLSAMRDESEALTLSFEEGKPVWRLLNSGRRISAKTAQHIVNRIDVQPSGDTLFPGACSQTYTARRRA
jgi:hypothetical protein